MDKKNGASTEQIGNYLPTITVTCAEDEGNQEDNQEINEVNIQENDTEGELTNNSENIPLNSEDGVQPTLSTPGKTIGKKNDSALEKVGTDVGTIWKCGSTDALNRVDVDASSLLGRRRRSRPETSLGIRHHGSLQDIMGRRRSTSCLPGSPFGSTESLGKLKAPEHHWSTQSLNNSAEQGNIMTRMKRSGSQGALDILKTLGDARSAAIGNLGGQMSRSPQGSIEGGMLELGLGPVMRERSNSLVQSSSEGQSKNMPDQYGNRSYAPLSRPSSPLLRSRSPGQAVGSRPPSTDRRPSVIESLQPLSTIQGLVGNQVRSPTPELSLPDINIQQQRMNSGADLASIVALSKKYSEANKQTNVHRKNDEEMKMKNQRNENENFQYSRKGRRPSDVIERQRITCSLTIKPPHQSTGNSKAQADRRTPSARPPHQGPSNSRAQADKRTPSARLRRQLDTMYEGMTTAQKLDVEAERRRVKEMDVTA